MSERVLEDFATTINDTFKEKKSANLLAWLTDEVNVDEYSFAQYCAMCAVLDERVVDLQLKRCSNADVKALLCSLFGHGDDITNFLVHNSAQATAAQTALLGLLKVEWRDGDPLTSHGRCATLCAACNVQTKSMIICGTTFADSFTVWSRCGGSNRKSCPSDISRSVSACVSWRRLCFARTPT